MEVMVKPYTAFTNLKSPHSQSALQLQNN